MRVQPRDYLKIAFLFIALGLCQCGKKTKSQLVSISVNPPTPIVFTSDFTTNKAGSPVTIKGPWFEFGVSIDNESDTPITIIALHIEVTGANITGQSTTKLFDFVPASDDFTDVTGLICNYNDYGQFDELNHQDPVTKLPTNTNKGSLNEGATGCPTGPVLFFADANPLPANVNLIRYSVKVQPEGWFGTRTTPSDRFNNFSTIYTQ